MGVTTKHITKPSKEDYPTRIFHTTYPNHNWVVFDIQHPTNVLHKQTNQHKIITNRVETGSCHVMCEVANLPNSMINKPKGMVPNVRTRHLHPRISTSHSMVRIAKWGLEVICGIFFSKIVLDQLWGVLRASEYSLAPFFLTRLCFRLRPGDYSWILKKCYPKLFWSRLSFQSTFVFNSNQFETLNSLIDQFHKKLISFDRTVDYFLGILSWVTLKLKT